MTPLDSSSPATDSSLRLVSPDAAQERPTPAPAPAPPRTAHLRVVQDEEELDPVLCQRDPAFIRRIYPLLAAITDHYYRAEVEGMENMSDRASLVISTHNGGMYMPDMLALQVAFWRRFGMETRAYGMGHKAAIDMPIAREFVPKIGAIYASPENAKLVLDSDAPLLICPGGDMDSLKPFTRRHKIQFGQRMGFIRTAIRHQAPIIPVVSVGAHEVFFGLTEGKRLARLLRFDKMFRIKAVPLTLGFPLGITPGGIFHIPLPSKVKVRVLEPIHFDDAPEDAENPDVVRRRFYQVVRVMQSALDGMAAKRRWPLFG